MENQTLQKGSLVVVTGGAGFIGSHLCERLHILGCRVISLDNYLFGVEENHIDGVCYRRGHTKDIETVIPETPSLLYHLGEYARVEQSFADITTVLDSNVVGTKAVVEFCRKKKCKLVYAGSSTKFADGGIGRDQSPYAWTKASNTELVRNYGEWFDMPYAITYFYNVYGPRERGVRSSGTVVAIFAKAFTSQEKVIVYPPGTQRRNFTHVDDIVDGLILVGDRGSGDEYGLGHQDSYSILELADLFGVEVEMGSEQQGNRMQSNADIRRAQLELGWKPKRNLPEYVASIIS